MKANCYTRPDKPMHKAFNLQEVAAMPPPKTLAKPVTVDKATECHVTPADVAARMVSYLERVGDVQTLEPSAGTGALIKALYDAGQSPFEVTAIERHLNLYRIATSIKAGNGQSCTGFNECFLDYAERAAGKINFQNIIMNPPFKQVRQHIKAALRLLGSNGHDFPPTLVALVPITFDDSGFEVMEHLGPDTFASAKVNTKIIRTEL